MKIEILGIEHSVDLKPANDHGNEDYGEFFESDCLIRITENLPLVNKNLYLFHECIHAVNEILGLNLEEGQVTALAAGLNTIKMGNKKLINNFYKE